MHSNPMKALVFVLAWLGLVLPAAAQSNARLSSGTSQPWDGTLRLAHQYAAFSGGVGDFRDRLCQDLARAVGPAGLKVTVYPENKLVRNGDEVAALREGRAELVLLPAYNAVGLVPELEVTLLPGLIENYAQAARWKESAVGRELAKSLEERGVKVLAWVWQGAAMVSALRPLQNPDLLDGVRMRGVSPSMDETMRSVRAEVVPLSASELGRAFAEGRLDGAAATSSTLIAFGLDRYARALTTAGQHSFFYFFIPLVISSQAWARLTPSAQRALFEAAARFEVDAAEGVRADDEALARTFLAADALVTPLEDEHWRRWRSIARASSWRRLVKRLRGEHRSWNWLWP